MGGSKTTQHFWIGCASTLSLQVTVANLVSVGELADLPVSLALVGLALEASDGCVPDDRRLLGQGGHFRGVLVRAVELRKGRPRWSTFLSLSKNRWGTHH